MEKEVKESWWKGLKKTSKKFLDAFQQLFNPNSGEFYSRLEEHLLKADLGLKITHKVLAIIRTKGIRDPQIAIATVKEYLVQLIKGSERRLVLAENIRPFVVLFVGVNGTGKTTTIGKIGALFKKKGNKVMFGAGDTFRAAAVEQLKIWGERLSIPVVAQSIGADSAAVAFDAYQAAKARDYDLLLIDTAGRLHNKQGLMDELKKIERCLKKQVSDLPHEIILVLDASIGQNSLRQVEEFVKNFHVTGLVLSKLDGTAKGGAIFAIAEVTKLPIYYVGVGEKSEDLLPFNGVEFVEAIFKN